MTYWQQIIQHLENDTHDYKLHQLPLARIKKVMKADPEVKMISAEAPILFAKGCDIFITELTMRAWIHAEENKRRTLQRSDIASALTKSDMFDFLIDIVPREEAGTAKRTAGQANPAVAGQSGSGPIPSQQGGGQPPPHPHAQGSQHPMGPPEYAMGHNTMPQDREFGQNPGMYSQVPPDANSAYNQQQPQMYGDLYGYPSMGQQQVHMSGGSNRPENM
jgi:nuclear transcription factor Y, gamma